jgi:dihydroorotase-like cyclic amidohydrolase
MSSEVREQLVRGATVYDGTRRPGRRADVFIRGERIAAATEPGEISRLGRRVIDLKGLAVAPGLARPSSTTLPVV